MLTRRDSICSWRVEPNVFEAAKSQVIFDAKDSSKQYLPRFKLADDRFPQISQWIDAFSSDNSPEIISFQGHDITQDLESVDFSKPYNDKIAQEIRGRYSKVKKEKFTTMDAELMIMGELGELE